MAESERRYLMMSPDDVALLLDKRGDPESYSIRTIYLERPGSMSPTRFRLRYYDGDNVGWLERKRRRGVFVAKRRRHEDEMPVPGDLVRIAHVTYDRLAWEFGDLRVTLDLGVNDGSRLLAPSVLEVKGEKVPKWLRDVLPDRARTFSKRRWATGRWSPAADASVQTA